jgi:pimeloyl-ACP methyl ester carboxylesterase
VTLTIASHDGSDIRAFDEGSGPVILVLHPGLDDGRGWGKVAKRLMSRFRVIRIHRRQYREDLKQGTRVSIAQEVDDVTAVVKAVGEPMIVVGHSSGEVHASTPAGRLISPNDARRIVSADTTSPTRERAGGRS